MNNAIPDHPRWFCIRSQQKHEGIAAAHLRQINGVEVFCPRVRLKRATRTGAKWFNEAMFPGYLFACFHLETFQKEVQYAAGVAGILRFGDRYITIDDEVVGALRRHTNEQGFTVIAPEITVGKEVKVIDGALRGMEAVVTQVLSGGERLRILLTFLGQPVEAEIQKGGVFTATPHPLASEGLSR